MSLCNRMTAEFSVCLQCHCVKMRLGLTMLCACPCLPWVLSQLELAGLCALRGPCLCSRLRPGSTALCGLGVAVLLCQLLKNRIFGELKFSVLKIGPKHVQLHQHKFPIWEFPFGKAVVYSFIWTITKCCCVLS